MYHRNYSFTPVVFFLLIGIMVGLIIGLGFLATNPYTPAGHEGYVFERPRIFGKGGFKKSIAGPSNFGLSFLRNTVINIDIRPNTYTEKFRILAKDDLNISFNFHIILAIKSGSVKDVVDKFGGQAWYQRFVREPVRTYIRQAIQDYASTELKGKRNAIALSVQKHIKEYLSTTPFVIVNIAIGDIEYPQIVAQAVEKKLASQQLLAEKAIQKAIAQQDAQIKIEEAKGIAEAQKIINSTLTANYLQHEAIHAQLKMADSPNHTTVYIPVGTNGIPLILPSK